MKVLTMPISTIVVLTDTLRIDGGASKVARASALGLANAGCRVIFVVGEDASAEFQVENVEVVSLNLSSISVPVKRHKTMFTGLWNVRAARRLKQVLSKLDPLTTVVHLHSWTKSLSTSVVPVIRSAGFPLVLTLHDYFVACPNGGFYDYQRGNVCCRKPLGLECLVSNCDSRMAAHKIWRVVRQFIQNGPGGLPGAVKAFVAVSDFSHHILQPFLPSNAAVYRVNNPIESIQLPPAQPSKAFGVLYVGRLSKEKGPDLLAEAARKVGVKVTFVGDGDLKRGLKEKYPEHQFTGWLPFDDILPLIDQTRALVFPSRWYETLGLSVLECASRGVPSIVADRCAAAEEVDHEKTGLLFASGDMGALSQAILRLEDNQLVEKMGANAYKRFWNSPYSLENHVKELMRVYDRVLA